MMRMWFAFAAAARHSEVDEIDDRLRGEQLVCGVCVCVCVYYIYTHTHTHSSTCKFLEPNGPEQPVVILYVRPFVRAACGNYNCIGFIFLAFAVARDIFYNTVRYGCDLLDIYEAGAVNSCAVAEEERSVVREQHLTFAPLCSVMII